MLNIGTLVTYSNSHSLGPLGKKTGVGTVLGDRYSDSPHHGYMHESDPWCNVLWATGEVASCRKKDLEAVKWPAG